MKTRIISVTYPSSEYPDDLVLLSMPDTISDERIRAELVYWAGIARNLWETDCAQDYADLLLNTFCNAFPGASWRYVEPFATLNIDHFTTAYPKDFAI